MAELVDALVSNTSGKPCRFDPGSGYLKAPSKEGAFFVAAAEVELSNGGSGCCGRDQIYLN